MLRALLHLLAFLLAALGGALASAEPPAAALALVDQARAKALAQHPYWRALLHYRRAGSEILSPDFFLSPRGATDPAAELEATLMALFEPPGDKQDNHAQCRFVARYKWLRKSLEWGRSTPPAVACPQYSAYTTNHQVESLSLVYATGYLSNPASFYGHILLKFNTRRAAQPSELLDRALNFGAVVPANENGFVYVLKGLFGGYDASFTHQQFYAVNHAYAENELRDMWEYELALTDDEVDQVVAHSWELLGKKYAYFFLKENCGYRMAELLELVIGQPLLPDLPWSLPAAVFDRLAAVRREGKPVVREVRRIASRQSRFRERYEAMTQEQRSAASEAVDAGLDLHRPGYATLDEKSRVAVVDTLLDYYEYRIVLDKQAIELKRAKQALLIERSALPARGSPLDDAVPSEAAPPHQGPLPFMLRPEALHNSHFGTGIGLRIRPANYDPLALDAARIPHSALAMFDLKLVYLDDRLKLRHLDFVNVEHLNMPKTPLPEDGGWAWKFRLALESQDLRCGGCTVLNATYGLGKALPITRDGVAFGMLDLFAQTKHENSGTLGAMPRVGLVAAPLAAWKTSVTLGRRSYLNGSRAETSVARWDNRLGSSRHWDLRIAYEEHVAREFQAALSFYW